VKKETEKVLDQLSLEQGISKSEIVHRAVMDYCQPTEDIPFTPSDIAGVAQDVKGKPTAAKGTVFTKEGAIRRIAWMRLNGYTEKQITDRAATWVIA